MSPEAWVHGALVNAAEATVLALAVWAITRKVRHAGLAHILWCAVLADLVVPPLLTIPGTSLRLAPAEPDPVEADTGARVEGSAPALAMAARESTFPVEVTGPESPDPERSHAAPAGASWSAIGLAWRAWLAGACAVLAITLARALEFHRRLRSARGAPPAIRQSVARQAAGAGLARVPEVLLLDARVPPLVWALGGRARLILPAGILGRLDAVQVEMLIAHEVAHLARRDHWLRWPEAIVAALYWWCPAAWWARGGMRRAEEDCCDGYVRESFPGAPLEYAKALMETVDFLSASPPIPAMASGLGREGRLLKRRFDMILDKAPGHRLSRPLLLVIVAVLAAALPWSPGILAGQDDGDRKPAGAGEEKYPPNDPTNPKNIPGDVKRAEKAPATEMEARLASLEKQVAALLAEVKKQQAFRDPDSVHEKKGEDELAWHKWKKQPGDIRKGGRVYRIEGNRLAAFDPATSKALWVTVLPLEDPMVEILDEGIAASDGWRRLIIDPKTGSFIRKEPVVHDGDPANPGPWKNSKLWRKNQLPRVSGDSKPPRSEDKNELPRVSGKPTLKEIRAEKERLRERLLEIETLEAKLEAAEKDDYRKN